MNLPGHEFLAHAGLAFEKDGEIGRRYPLDRRTQPAHDGRGADERRGSVPANAVWIEEAGTGQLCPRTLDLEDEGPQIRSSAQHLKVPVAQTAIGIEGDFQKTLRFGIRARDLQRHRLRAMRRGSTSPPIAVLAQVNASDRNDPAQRGFECPAHQRDVEPPIERACERRQQIRHRFPSIPLA